MIRMPGPTGRRFLRYALVGAIVLVIAGLFVQRERSGGDSAAAAGLLDERTFAVGELAPDFEVKTIDGGTIRLSELRGQTVVLNFWASWCSPCRAEMPEFQQLWEERAPRGDLTVLAVNFLREDSVPDATRFARELELTFPVAFDTPEGDIGRRYAVRGLPATFFIDREGVVRDAQLGPVFGELLPEKVAKADAAAGG